MVSVDPMTEAQRLPANANGLTNRRGSSDKRHSDVSESKFPVITKTAYNGMLNFGNKDGAVNRKMHRLCMGRIRIAQAKLVIDGAMRDWNPQVPDKENPREEDRKVYNALRSISNAIDKAYLSYPIEVRA